jgi:hypothetical protein
MQGAMHEKIIDPHHQPPTDNSGYQAIDCDSSHHRGTNYTTGVEKTKSLPASCSARSRMHPVWDHQRCKEQVLQWVPTQILKR